MNKLPPLLEEHRPRLEELCLRFGVRRLELFGSAADGRFDPGRSDFDFLVEFESSDFHGAADRYFGLMEGLQAGPAGRSGRAAGNPQSLFPPRHRRIEDATLCRRNVLIHGYDVISDRVVWDVVQNKLPLLRVEVEALLAEPDTP